MKKALILYWHGLGDVIMLTPHLRHLYKQGYIIDLMCRPAVHESRLLNDCPYINQLIEVENPWQSKLGRKQQSNINMIQFYKIKEHYDWSGASPHNTKRIKRHKIDMTSAELGITLGDRRLEVFISANVELEAMKYIDGDYVFVQTMLEFHKYHDWDSTEWVKKHFPSMRMMNLGYGNGHYKAFSDINTAFIIAREAKHRVLSSGVFVHACEAMDCVIDVINYGRPDHKVWPLDQEKVLHIRERGQWIK